MSETGTKAQTAEQALEQAERGVEEVLERIKDGDEEVGPEDLEAAESRVRFARARIEGEERRRIEEAERERLERIDALKERALALDPKALRKLEEAARKALSAYVASCVAHNVKVEEIAGELELLGPLPEGFGVDWSSSSGPSVTAGGRRSATIRPMVNVAAMAREALREHIPHGFIDLEQPY
jgi:hypothetical protein